ncbi:MAG TPA: RNase adapter RapZ [Acidimicrobiales bacterium]|nr:RNase adapter RapZ [Acidimicrobiales bacterium]
MTASSPERGLTDYALISGMSGAGRSTAAAALEDAGWYVIDNMPSSLLTEVADIVGLPGSGQERVALVIGRGGGQVEQALPAVDTLRARGHRVRVVYLDAPQDILVRRFEGTRRRHPIAGANVEEAIVDERRLLEPIRDRADVVVDTGQLNVNQLRVRILELFADESDTALRTSVVSFGYKHGVPLDADLVFDCRFLPNPHWIPALQPLSGLDEPVREFVLAQEPTAPFLDRVVDLVTSLLPAYVAEGKSYLTIAMGCTGGRHRSVVLADELSRRLHDDGAAPSVFHRDVDR